MLRTSCRRALFRVVCASALAVSFLSTATAQAKPTTPAPFAAAELQALERVALDLRGAGRDDEADVVRAALAECGAAPPQLAELDRRLAAVKPSARGGERGLQRIGEQLAKTCNAMAARLAAIPDPARRARAASALLSLDDGCAAAHQALGHVAVGDQWVTAEEEALRPRAQQIQDAVQRARRLAPQIEVAESAHPLLLLARGRPGLVAKANGVAIHSHWPEARLRRVVAGVLQAEALSRHLLDGGELALPVSRKFVAVHVTDEKTYAKLARHDVAERATDEKLEEIVKYAGYWRRDGVMVRHGSFENHVMAACFAQAMGLTSEQLGDRVAIPSLLAGHANWVLMALAGAQMPNIAFEVVKSAAPGTRVGAFDPTRELLSGAGLMGARMWLRGEVVAGADPAWSRSFKPQIGMVDGVDLLKTTFVVEYLQQRGPLGATLDKTRAAAQGDVPAMTKAVEAAIGQPLADFEAAWRAWIRGVGAGDSVRARLGGRGDRDPAAAVVDLLARLRSAAHVHPWLQDLPVVRGEPGLSAGARAHARYLHQHAEQLARWPDAHEQYTDRAGFSAEGAWAGNHSVIASGIKAPAAAVDQWMGTYFHRLPLLEPGLLRVGWAFEHGIAVLDTGSVVRPMKSGWEVVWPHDGMQAVPRRFVPELPSPFPGEDQEKWGYPITLQMGQQADQPTPEIAMTLREGGETGREVECLLSSPQAPGNPQLVPGLAWCLIPTEALQPDTKYHVHVELRTGQLADGGTALRWSFRTGR